MEDIRESTMLVEELRRLGALATSGDQSGRVPIADELDKEVAGIDIFDEDYMTDFDKPDQPTFVIIEGIRVRVHRTNNFHAVFRIYDKFRQQGTEAKAPGTHLEKNIRDSANQARYEQIFATFEKEFPNLYLLMQAISNVIEQQRKLIPKKEIRPSYPFERAERDYYSSAAYSAMARIARSIDKDYDLRHLYH